MNETDARNAYLVRAYETLAPAEADRHWTVADREWATEAALRVEGESAGADAFVARRAQVAQERLCARDTACTRLLGVVTWRPWIGWGLAVVALMFGIASDAIGPAQRINVLAPPLLALIAWNLVVYVVLSLRAVRQRSGAARPVAGVLARGIARLMAFMRERDAVAGPLAAFARDWSGATAELTAARATRALHVAAAAFAVGALLSLYLRGVAFEYLAGWESTFFAASTVHALLSVVLGPASAISGIALPDAAGVAAIGNTVSAGENAARWIHLYAITVALVVLLPRIALALLSRLAERRLAHRFDLPMDDGYFSALAGASGGAAAAIRVVPYALTPNPDAVGALRGLMARVFGARIELIIAPTVPFGAEDALGVLLAIGPPTSLVCALFALTATPERENHGAFLAALAAHSPAATPLAVLVDESAFRLRFGDAPGAGALRREERRAAWRQMLAEADRDAVFIDLASGENDAHAERSLRAAIGRARAPAKAG